MNKKDINFNYKRLHPFKWFILENYPFLEDSIDVLTNYQLFCKLGEMYNKEINAINTLGIQVESITDWFDNLDLQEEVNNKLDDMAESGELEEIIASYINTNALICFDTVSDLKSSENLVDGSYARTLGFYSINDGGKALYKIREITNDDVVNEHNIIALNDDNLIAELIPDSIINVLSLGAFKNETGDNTFLEDFINDIYYGHQFYFPAGTYVFNDNINLHDNFYVTLENNAILKYNGDLAESFISTSVSNGNIRESYIRGGIIDSNNKTNITLYMRGEKTFLIKNCKIQGFKTHAIYIKGYTFIRDNEDILTKGQGYVQDCYIYNTFANTNTYGIYEYYENNNTSDNKYENIIMRDVTTGIRTADCKAIEIHPWIGTTSLIENSCIAEVGGQNSSFVNCFKDTLQYGFKILTNSCASISNLRIYDNPLFYTQEAYTLYPQTVFDLQHYSYVKCSNVTGVIYHNMTFVDFNDYTPSGYNEFKNCYLNGETGVTIYNAPIPDSKKTKMLVKNTSNFSWTNGTAALTQKNANISFSSDDVAGYTLESVIINGGFQGSKFIGYVSVSSAIGTSAEFNCYLVNLDTLSSDVSNKMQTRCYFVNYNQVMDITY